MTTVVRYSVIWLKYRMPALSGVIATLFVAPAIAQQAAQEKPGAARSVLLFDKLCYEMVPDFASLEKRAGALKWTPITGQKLQGFKPAAPAKVLKAWSFADLGVSHQIAISQADMDEQGKKDYPAFADAQVFSCTLVLPARKPRAEVSAAMQKLMGSKPDETSAQGRVTFDVWGGEDKQRKVLIQHMGATLGGPGGLIGITFILKP